MSGAENKALARRWFEGAYNEVNLALADEVFAPGFTLYGQPSGGGVGSEGQSRSYGRYAGEPNPEQLARFLAQ